MVHDAARPCASRTLIERVAAAAARHGAAIPALAINETVKRYQKTVGNYTPMEQRTEPVT